MKHKASSGKARRCAGGWMILWASAVMMWLSGCADGPGGTAAYQAPSPEALASGGVEETRESKPAEERPGLATGFGKRVKDPWHRQSFVRDAAKPKGTDVIYYNDREGVDAMTSYKRKVGGLQSAAGELVEWGIKGRVGFLPSYKTGYYGENRRFVVGSEGAPYSIVLRNRCKSRLEVVVSVDGLDVIDGKPASFGKRGYVISPGKTLEIKGWRTSWDGVARFEFSDVGASYTNQRYGKARNVGVIGLAVFGEKGVDPWKWMPNEVETRTTANPFAESP
ncbi:MAG: hypothetical protein AAGI48_00625 [Verrucomicrobiota bacterium]